jgi:formyl-CoA transferase
MLAEWMARHEVAEVLQSFAEAGLPAAPVRTYREAAADPHVRDREMLQPVDIEGNRRVPVVGPVAKFSRTPTRVRTGAPALGADSDAILEELGVDADERDALRRDGILGA